jgi:hypothetical protein
MVMTVYPRFSPGLPFGKKNPLGVALGGQENTRKMMEYSEKTISKLLSEIVLLGD